MDINVKKIKILSEISGLKSKIEDAVRGVGGVVDVKINEVNSSIYLEYAITEHASDYDVMVSILDILEKDFNLETDVFIDSDDEVDFGGVYEAEEYTNSDDDNHDSTDCNNCHTHSHNERCSHTDSESCSCGHDEHATIQSKKGKIIELAVAVFVFIIGIILKAIPATTKVSDYVLIGAFAIAGYEIIFESLIKLFNGKFFSVDLLMTIASFAAIILGETVEAVGIIVLYSIGELFEVVAIENSKKVIDGLKKLIPDKVFVVLEDGKIIEKDCDKLEVGDVILLKAGDKSPIDGVIIEGSASFDTKAVTGESSFKDLKVDDSVYGGFYNKNGTCKVKAIKNYKDSTLSKIIEIVENSKGNKSKQESLIDKFAKWYTPAVVIIALLLAFVMPIFEESYKIGLSIWLVRAVMLLCISCPCSLVVSVPLSYYCGVGLLAKHGILAKSSNSLEKLSNCNVVVFDKTGTLTKGELKVSKIISTKKYAGKVLGIISKIETLSNHPIAKSILSKGDVASGEVSNFKEVSGLGISATFNGQDCLVGSYKFLTQNGVEFKENEELGTKIYLSIDKEFAGLIVLNDEIKKEAYGAIKELKAYGVNKTVMLTGDNKEYAKEVRKELKINVSVSELLPNEKVEEIEKLISQNDGKSVAFVGDGINDAPSITRADVGFSMGALGSNIAIDSSDIVITDDDLSKVPYTVKIAKRTHSIATQNIVASLVIKFGVMLLSVLGLSQSLWLAIGSDVGLLILTILNAIRNKFDY